MPPGHARRRGRRRRRRAPDRRPRRRPAAPSAIVATVPVWPPASVPWATTKSTPLATALTAWRTLPHMLPTRMFLECKQVDHLTRHAEAGDEDPRPAVDHRLDALLDLSGQAPSAGRRRTAWRSARERRPSRPAAPSAAHRRRPERADPAGLADRGDQPVVADAAHPGEHDRVFDVEQIGQPRAHAQHRSESHPSVCGPRAADPSVCSHPG